MSARTAPAPAAVHQDDQPADLTTFYRWFDARTQFAATTDKARWTPASALHADYLRWHKAAVGTGTPLDEQSFERGLREDTRLTFEMLEVQKDFGSEPEMALCVNRALRAAIHAVR